MSSNRVVAVIGASNNRRKFGNRAVRAYLEQGYTVIRSIRESARWKG